ncbi:MAG TPA: LytR C-terminal domain-containing protein [Gemmatimonadales bacterium]|nr:LytR C-terminal domain-containing protein [Gemmatimonadales bacterium]
MLYGRSASRDRVTGHAYDIPSGDDRTIVEVFNGSKRTGLGRLAARRLRKYGIDVVLFATASDTTTVDTTQVILRRGDRARADQVLKVLGAGKVVMATDTLRRVDVTVILGRDYQPDNDGRP